VDWWRGVKNRSTELGGVWFFYRRVGCDAFGLVFLLLVMPSLLGQPGRTPPPPGPPAPPGGGGGGNSKPDLDF
jgi:hypothetical protein